MLTQTAKHPDKHDGVDDVSDIHRAKLATIRSYAALCKGERDTLGPLDVFLEVSNVCNLKCAMCGMFSAINPNKFKQLREQDRGFMESDELLENLRSVLRGALVVHCFGTGEPTIHPGFRELIAEIDRNRAMADFFTNGMHLEQDMCEFLVDQGVYQVVVSFSGSTKEIYENIYIGGNFERVLAGIRRLADVKAARHVQYPIIHINSVGFKDHIASFERFVELMAEHGANGVRLSSLNVLPAMPHLYEHVSIMRPEQEGAIIRRAEERGKELGITVNTAAYTRNAAADDAAFARREASLRRTAEGRLRQQEHVYGGTPVTEFKKIAKTIKVIPDNGVDKTPPPVVPLDADRAEARAALDPFLLNPDPSADSAIHCLQPFMTMHVARNGPAKPCCRATSGPGGAPYLGNTKANDATDVWHGAGYKATRELIINGEYPAFCKTCVKNNAVLNQSIIGLIQTYLVWHEARFGPGLRAELDAASPDALKTIRTTSLKIIMAAVRDSAASRPCVRQ